MIAEICESVHPTSIVVTQIDGARVVPAEVLSDVFRKYTDAEIFYRAGCGEGIYSGTGEKR